MYSNVKQKRINGVERTARELAADPGVFGELRIHRVGGFRSMHIREWGNNNPDGRILPDLWEPEIDGWSGPTMLFRGWQRASRQDDKSKPTYLQEWLVTIIDKHPPAGTAHSVLKSHGR